MTGLQVTLDFLSDVAAHNSRPWFEANRARYEQAAAAFEALTADVIAEIARREDLQGVSARDCLYRFYRDVRFSKDKSPYKTHMGAAIGPEGRRSPRLSLYVHVEPGNSFVANGLYEPDKAQLERVRRAIADDAEDLREIIGSSDFVRWFGGIEGEQLKTAPQGYDRQHPAIDLLRRKQYLAVHHLTDADVVQVSLVPRIVGAYEAMQAFMRWLSEAAG